MTSPSIVRLKILVSNGLGSLLVKDLYISLDVTIIQRSSTMMVRPEDIAKMIGSEPSCTTVTDFVTYENVYQQYTEKADPQSSSQTSLEPLCQIFSEN